MPPSDPSRGEQQSLLRTAHQSAEQPRDTRPPVPFERAAFRSNEWSGYVILLIASLGYAAETFLVHLNEYRNNFPPLSSAFANSQTILLMNAIYLLLFVPRSTVAKSLCNGSASFVLLRGLFGPTAMACLYTAFGVIPLGPAMSILFTSPVITVILSFLALGEPFGVTDVVSCALSASGSSIVFLTGGGQNDLIGGEQIQASRAMLGYVLAGCAAVLLATVSTITRFLGRSVHFAVLGFSAGLCGTIATAALGHGFLPHHFLDNRDAAMISIPAGFGAFVGMTGLSLGLQRCDAGAAMLILNVQVIFAFLLGYYFLQEQPTLLRACGCCLILLAAIVIGIKKMFVPSR